MPHYYTNYLTNNTMQRTRTEGERALWVAANGIIKRGVIPRDYIYAVTVVKGKLFLLYCVEVGKFYNFWDWIRKLGVSSNTLWQANDFAVAIRATRINFHREVPLEVTRKLQFVSPSRTSSSLKFLDPTKENLDVQTIRNIRELTPSSANLFDQLMDELELLTEEWIIQDFRREHGYPN